MLMILLVILVIVALGGLPAWGYHSYGYAPSGLVLVVVVILCLLLFTGRL